MTVNKLIALQSELVDNLKKAEKNFKKSPKERIKLVYVETKLGILEQLYLDFKNYHKQIITSATKDDKKASYFTEDVYETFEELYVDYKTLLTEQLQALLPPVRVQAAAVSTPGGKFESEHGDVRLPRVNLPTFSGKYEEWQSFYDMFSTLIHNSKSITSVQKLHYLKGSLTGEALNLLREYSTTEANYEEAWKQLIRRYNNKRYNCNAILRNLFAIRKVQSESASGVRYLLDTTSTCIKSLQNIGITTDSWDVLIIYLVVSKLDVDSIKQWEQQINMFNDDLPTWSQLQDFLEGRFRSLEMIDNNVARPTQTNKTVMKAKTFHMAIENQSKNSGVVCAMCSDNHYIYHCKRFELMTARDRQDFVQNKRLCFNCLSPTHAALKCRQSRSCRKCGKRHHTMLHFERKSTEADQMSTAADGGAASSSPSKPREERDTNTLQGDTHITTAFSRGELHPNSVLLATARIKVRNLTGCKQILRALLDQGSQASFVTEATVQLLGLTRKPVSGWVSGLGDGHTRIKYTVSFCVESRHSPDKIIHVNAYVLRSLTTFLPAAKLSIPEWPEMKNVPLADPSYTTPGKIDILLGAEVYGEILLDGLIKQSSGTLMAQNTVFGWIVSGRASRDTEEVSRFHMTSLHLQVNGDDLLRKFWEMEDEPDTIQKTMSRSEQLCEQYFEATTVRDREGRLVVRLPFTSDDPKSKYGHSREIALKRLHLLEKKLSRDPKLRQEYNKVFEEYLNLNHMVEVPENELENPYAVYLPHHAVVREDKETTKVRIVFDASSKGVNNVSLNDDLMVGPKLQQDLRHILMRWRNHKICIVADIVKMYRMVRVAEEDNDYQRVVWRFTSDGHEHIKHYRLLRLTFGTACAPYLAVKALQKLAELEQDKYPLAAAVTKRDFYMDDLMTGADTEPKAFHLYDEMNQLMKAGGFQLQKWNSNSATLLQQLSQMSDKTDESSETLKLNRSIKVLGVSWNRESDTLEYNLNELGNYETITKRQVLSDLARLYDPLGLIAPVVLVAKLFMQTLWQSGLGWDEHLPQELLQEWLNFRSSLAVLRQIKVPRWLNATSSSRMELHAFADASRSAFAAAVFARVIDERDMVHVHLVTAKTKVAPIEKEVSIPRLELCGATLAAKLLCEVSQIMEIPKERMYGWTDSTIVLAWLKAGSSRWTTFVSNRVSTILTILDYEQWHHVPTESNPADCASRGLSPSELLTHPLWWHGPQWLADNPMETGNSLIVDTHEEERITACTVVSINKDDYIWSRFSSLTKMQNVLSYCRRWLRLRLPRDKRPPVTQYISVTESNQTLMACIKLVQESSFESDIKHLKSRGWVPKSSNLRSLCPFFDKTGILRVTGRIKHSDASYDTRHPIILPAQDHLSRLIIIDAHHRTLHGGPQIMLNYLRSRYWILQVKERAKKTYRECVTCRRYSNKRTNPFMGLLPEARLKPSKPFKSAGVDYCGPVNIRFSPGRGAKSYKGYICLFVCMVTRAVHLEAVTDLTAKGFIAAFRRFTARRGHCQDLYSDNGTNFVGADRELKEMFNRAKSSLSDEIANLLTLEHTSWHFICPHAPNFGGLWEAGVRSTKTHLRKVVGTTTLTYEEMSTVLAQVEACLNSRPLTLLSDDPNDPLPLTPGHFLVGEALLNITDDNYTNCNIHGLDRWRLTQKIVNDFWSRWNKEYLVNLNQRHKWNTPSAEPELDSVVILREDNVPPAKWILGRIIAKHTGVDNITRVVSVKCKSGILKRPVSKLCILTK